MQGFLGKTAIVTGGASGIGRALSEHLVRGGARVVVADRDVGGAEAVAQALGSSVEVAELDVTDADAFARVVQRACDQHGRLDYLFNNAGIAIGGEVRFMELADWSRLIDVNVRGVIHGVHAAYPRMIEQGAGHIVNTASVAGLGPVPGMAIYAMTKHAVVGLSIALRGEARRYGVRVSAACPGFVRTPILDTSPLVGVDREQVLRVLPLAPVDGCAAAILRGVQRNRAIIPYTAMARAIWLLYRLLPGFTIDRIVGAAARNPLLAATEPS